MIAAYGGNPHRRFVNYFNSFIASCCAEIRQSTNYPEGSIDYVTSLRERTISHAVNLLDEGTGSEWHVPTDLEDYFEKTCERIVRSASRRVEASERFRETWEELIATDARVTIVFLTATDVEDEALASAVSQAGFSRTGFERTTAGIGTRYTGGLSKEIVHFRTSAGSLGASGSELVTAEAVSEIRPDFVIAVGICFGLKPGKGGQRVGDVLISDKVTDYETVRVCFSSGEESLGERGFRVPPSSDLLDAARIVRRNYSTGDTNVFAGEFISGLKLLDSLPEVKELRIRFPDALGGEMEATGVVAASLRHNVGWIIVKAICDWGYKKSKKSQHLAADNAAEFSLKVARVVFEARRKSREMDVQ